MDGHVAVGLNLLLTRALVDAGWRPVNGLNRLKPLQPQVVLNSFHLISKGFSFIAETLQCTCLLYTSPSPRD